MKNTLKMGVDIGSTTIKMVVINEEEKLLYKTYRRHYSEIKNAFIKCLEDCRNTIDEFEEYELYTAVSGSGGMGLAEKLKVEFVQEVVASTKAVQKYNPETDVIIELGGEDAKITYLKNGVEQRMNGTCAGGTGAFIDQMASLLDMNATQLNEEAKDYKQIYKIAARCGVFAKTDIQPLINEGAEKADIAISIFHAVVMQSISALACGHPIKGNVAFLGGPLTFLSELRKRFIEVLNLKPQEVIFPENSELYVAMGTALMSGGKGVTSYNALINNINKAHKETKEKKHVLKPLFENEEEYHSFVKRHSENVVKQFDISLADGRCYLGIDAGSTTTKAVLINDNCEIVYSYYSDNKGNPVNTTTKILKDIYSKLPDKAEIVNSAVTGYGEGLLKEAFKIDIGEIETVAHYKGAKYFHRDVDFILDIGGQDMKCLRIENNNIASITLNEACSAGCGSFLQAFAKSLGIEIKDFAKKALLAKNPVDLGSRCTVFMNSKVKQAQKEGFSVEDIAAGLAYSVVKNSLYKVIKLRNSEELGQNIVVQGGTFYNDAVLRSFELLSKKNVIRPNISGLMGAFGAAIIAKERYTKGYKSTIADKEEIENINMKSAFARCGRCGNNCMLTINTFANGNRFIAGNKCEAPLGLKKKNEEIPNLYEYKYERLFSYKPLSEKEAKRGIIGIPRVLNIYENYPLWFTIFTELKFRVEVSSPSSKKIYEKGISSIASETACYPAKIVHGHIEDLVQRNIKVIFYPCIVHEKREFEKAANTFNCPVVTSYAEVIKNNVDSLKENNVKFMNPFLPIADKKRLKRRLKEELKEFNIPFKEIDNAVEKAWEEQEKFKGDIKQKGLEALRYIKENNIKGILLSGRPYHIDPEINHGIPKLITSLNMAVFTEDSLACFGEFKEEANIVDQWAYHSRLYRAANFILNMNDINLVQLTSFGCGLDSVTTEAVSDILKKGNKIYTNIKIDEGSNLGAARIRLRSLKAAVEERDANGWNLVAAALDKDESKEYVNPGKEKTIIVPQFSKIHFDVLQGLFKQNGYDIVVLNNSSNAVNEGIKYVNNDMCYPAVVVIGQIIEALKSGKYDLENTAVLLAQSEGQCRFTNYVKVLEKALKEAGFENIPVISFNLAGVKKANALEGITFDMAKKAIAGIIYGDLLSRVVHRIRPYEKISGTVDKLYEKWINICRESFKEPLSKHFKNIIEGVIRDFENVSIVSEEKPKVGIVGELLVKFNDVANNNIIKMLENEGVEVVHNDFLTMFLANAKIKVFNYKMLEGTFLSKITGEMVIKFIEKYQKIYINALKKSKKFYVTERIDEMAENAEKILSIGNQSGEGWKLPGEILELSNWGVNNIICMQPFGCLPSHTIVRGSIKALKNINKKLNIVTIEYDPGASEVNQMNRIKLMLARAFNRI